MSSGFFLVLPALCLRHPFGLSTADSAFFRWFQAAATGVALTGIAWITWILIGAQCRGRFFDDDRDRKASGATSERARDDGR